VAQQTALIYNNFFETRGGGERSSLDLALALEALGFDVALASAQTCSVSVQELNQSFGISEEHQWPLYEFSSETELEEFIAGERFDVFVNHTSCSFMPNRASCGIYMAMFPLVSPPAAKTALRTYDAIACNSPFTKNYVLRRWGRDLNVVVIPPPVSKVHQAKKPEFEQKEALILNVGRFNVFGHNKCQLEAVRTFSQFVEDGVVDPSWKLLVAGHVNESPETNDYVQQCRDAAGAAANIEIRTNISLGELCLCYQRASVVWQFTGIGLLFGEKPGNCEHLGLAALDGFAYGAIPVVYHRGGMTYFIKHGFNGYCFGSAEELAQITRLLAHSFGTEFHRKLFDYTCESVQYFTFDVFKSKIAKVLEHASNLGRLQ